MRYAWMLGPYKSSFQDSALLKLEEQIDRIGEVGWDAQHPLTGSVVGIGDRVVYVCADGSALIAETGQLGICKDNGDYTYDLYAFTGGAMNPVSTEALIAHGAAIDSALVHAFLRRFGHGLPDTSDAQCLAKKQPAVSMEHLWQSARHLVF